MKAPQVRSKSKGGAEGALFRKDALILADVLDGEKAGAGGEAVRVYGTGEDRYVSLAEKPHDIQLFWNKDTATWR